MEEYSRTIGIVHISVLKIDSTNQTVSDNRYKDSTLTVIVVELTKQSLYAMLVKTIRPRYKYFRGPVRLS